MKKQSVFIFTKLMIFIADLEAKWKSNNEMWNAKQEKKKIKKRDENDENDDVEFIVNTIMNSNLSFQMSEQMNKQIHEQTNYMTFDLDDENHFEQNDENDYFN
jgi:hypothetical protein